MEQVGFYLVSLPYEPCNFNLQYYRLQHKDL